MDYTPSHFRFSTKDQLIQSALFIPDVFVYYKTIYKYLSVY